MACDVFTSALAIVYLGSRIDGGIGRKRPANECHFEDIVDGHVTVRGANLEPRAEFSALVRISVAGVMLSRRSKQTSNPKPSPLIGAKSSR